MRYKVSYVFTEYYPVDIIIESANMELALEQAQMVETVTLAEKVARDVEPAEFRYRIDGIEEDRNGVE